MTDYRDWFKSVTGRRITADEIATALKISRASATRRLTDDKLTADELITLCRTLEVDPVMALVDFERLTQDEVFDFMDSDGTTLATATQEQLIYRLAEDSLSAVEKLHLAQEVLGRDDLSDRRRSNTKPGHVGPDSYDGTVEEWDPSVPHAADHSTDEQAAREQRGEDPVD